MSIILAAMLCAILLIVLDVLTDKSK